MKQNHTNISSSWSIITRESQAVHQSQTTTWYRDHMPTVVQWVYTQTSLTLWYRDHMPPVVQGICIHSEITQKSLTLWNRDHIPPVVQGIYSPCGTGITCPLWYRGSTLRHQSPCGTGITCPLWYRESTLRHQPPCGTGDLL